jgi:hypothetical protein
MLFYSVQYNWHLRKPGDLIPTFGEKSDGDREKVQIAALYYSYVESYVEAKYFPPGNEDIISIAAEDDAIAPPSLLPSRCCHCHHLPLPGRATVYRFQLTPHSRLPLSVKGEGDDI